VLFTTADDVHDSLGRLMEELATDQDVGLRLSRLDTVVQLRYRNPDTKVTLVAREGDAPTVHLGETPQGTQSPELILTLDADVGHLLWLGRQNVPIGIARGLIQAKGDTRKVIELLELSSAIAPHYEALLRATGREALLDPDAGQPSAEDASPAAEPSAEGELAEGDAAADAEATGTEGDGTDVAGAADADLPAGAGGAEAAIAEGDQPA
jgi:hypothetical protein